MQFRLPARLRRLFGLEPPSPSPAAAAGTVGEAGANIPKGSAQTAIANPRERTLEQAIDFTFLCADMYLGLPDNGLEAFKDATIMEIGPGQDLGVLLVLAGLGSGKGVAVDRFFCDWDPSYHAAFYSKLIERAEARYPGVRFEALRDVVDQGGHMGPRLQIVRSGLDDLSALDAAAVTVSYSNAALEHLDRPREGLFELARVSRKGGLGFHQIDFRDHRDFNRPLEFLTMTDEEFLEKAEAASYSLGNRLRPAEYLKLFNEAGFGTTFTPNMFAEPAYLAEVRHRLNPRYQSFGPEALSQISGRVFTTRG